MGCQIKRGAPSQREHVCGARAAVSAGTHKGATSESMSRQYAGEGRKVVNAQCISL